jgi:hypothetical protein
MKAVDVPNADTLEELVRASLTIVILISEPMIIKF